VYQQHTTRAGGIEETAWSTAAAAAQPGLFAPWCTLLQWTYAERNAACCEVAMDQPGYPSKAAVVYKIDGTDAGGLISSLPAIASMIAVQQQAYFEFLFSNSG
jgi:hypothetical protein